MDTIHHYRGQWFDGVTALAREATIIVDGMTMRVQSSDRLAEFQRESIVSSAPVAGVPLRLTLPGGGVLVVREDAAALAALLPNPPQGLAHRLEQNLAVVAIALLAVAATAFFGWRDGVPWLAAKVAARIPLAAEADLGAATLATLDRILFEPTRLPADDQAEVQAAFAHLVEVAALPYRLELQFRHGQGLMGANALALPGGTIVMTDQLVTTVASVEAAAAVLAHEMGHQARRHAMEQLLESSAAALIFGAILGDVSGVGSLAATAPGFFIRLRYSRNVEDEADRYAYDLLRRAGSSPARLADALEAIDDAACKRGAAGREPQEGDDDTDESCAALRKRGGAEPEYMATHPDTLGRIERARAAAKLQ